MKFECDEWKARINLEKHDVDFRIAALIFGDPHILTIPDLDHSEEEDREISMGITPAGTVMIVVHTTRVYEKVETTRIISARKADKEECAVYFKRRMA